MEKLSPKKAHTAGTRKQQGPGSVRQRKLEPLQSQDAPTCTDSQLVRVATDTLIKQIVRGTPRGQLLSELINHGKSDGGQIRRLMNQATAGEALSEKRNSMKEQGTDERSNLATTRAPMDERRSSERAASPGAHHARREERAAISLARQRRAGGRTAAK